MKTTPLRGTVWFACMLATCAGAQTATDNTQPISRDEFRRLQEENQQLRREMEEMKAFRAKFLESWTNAPTAVVSPAPTANPTSATMAPPGGTNAVAEASAEGKATSEESKDLLSRLGIPGTTKMLLTGYGTAGFTSLDHEDAAFNASFNPMLLWKLNDRLLFEGELEFELEGNDTSTALEMANLSYVLNDYMTVGAGKFLNPMNAFVERYHMNWVNRLPDKPLAVYDGLLPETQVGAQLRGAVPLGGPKLTYSAFAANAPTLVRSVDNADDLDSLGTLVYDNFDNVGGAIATGGRIGFQPLPELEVGYGLEYSGVGSGDRAFLQSVDLSYMLTSKALAGTTRFNAQWVWSQLGRGTYWVEGNALDFNNNRDGGYAQVAYRPIFASMDWLKHLEGVFRYDMLNQDNTPVGYNEHRYTVGLNYWLTPKTVVKAAYQFDDKTHGATDNNGVLLQFTSGF